MSMAYNEKYEEVLKRYESKNLDAKNAAEIRAQELRSKFPEIAEMDAVLSKTAIRIMNASMEGGDYQAKVQSILDEVAAINEAIATAASFINTTSKENYYYLIII